MSNGIINVAPNLFLEQGHKLADWMPLLPMDYHYHLATPQAELDEGEQLIDQMPRPIVAVYVSNRDKDRLDGGWGLWNAQDWLRVLLSISQSRLASGCSFLFLGAEWDRDKTTDVSSALADKLGRKAARRRIHHCVARPLGVALHALRRANYFVAYPSGIGILANVLRVPGVMLLPWSLAKLAESFADPVDIATGHYRAWPGAQPGEAAEWICEVGMRQVLESWRGNWHE